MPEKDPSGEYAHSSFVIIAGLVKYLLSEVFLLNISSSKLSAVPLIKI